MMSSEKPTIKTKLSTGNLWKYFISCSFIDLAII